MAKEDYKKDPTTYPEQIERLQSRGLVFANTDKAAQHLSEISYYRLTGYWHLFKERDASSKTLNTFRTGATFENALYLYEFDRKLRLNVMDAIERAEVIIRTQITYNMTHKYGPFAHADAASFHDSFKYAEWYRRLEKDISDSKETFIDHFKTKYNGFPKVPLWMATEITSFGAISFMYKGMKNDDKKVISEFFEMHHKTLLTWLHTLTYIRNICAHHARLWNRDLSIRPKTEGLSVEWLPPVTPTNRRVFIVLLMLRHLLKSTSNCTDWQTAVTNLLLSFDKSIASFDSMGIPEGWQEHPIWK
tara:strand:+ start:800 stop:1711 length:912 start_codon:yes stop_codon:yes gene_type:complete